MEDEAAPATAAEAAPAKVNLYLHVTGRRADGYHLLDSLAVFAGAADRVTAVPARTLSLTVTGPERGALGAGEDNLVLRAARAMAAIAHRRALDRGRRATIGAALALEKALPIASGIGGGSADAAAALRLLDRLWDLQLGPAGLEALAAGLGADVTVCVRARAARMGGVGEVLSAAPALPPFGLVLANPRMALATPAVFAARRGGFSAPAVLPESWPDAAAMAATLRRLRNDLEAPAVALCPAVAEVLAALSALPGALLARMSGSGATCFAILPDPSAAVQAALSLPPGWWRWGGGAHAPG